MTLQLLYSLCYYIATEKNKKEVNGNHPNLNCRVCAGTEFTNSCMNKGRAGKRKDMNREITLREYRKEDSKALEDIIREAWQYDEFCSPKIAAKLAGIFLYSCLANQTFTRVAVVEGNPTGIIMGKNIKAYKCPLKYRVKQIQLISSLYLSGEGRRVFKMFHNINQTDNELLRDCGKEYMGEVAFFAVSEKCRGIGIGKVLFNSLLDYMKKEQIQDFYLFTDTSCNFGFYEHQGMKRQGVKNMFFTVNGLRKEMDFFIYDYQLS